MAVLQRLFLALLQTHSLYFTATAQADVPAAAASRESPLFEAALDCVSQGFSRLKQSGPGGPTRQQRRLLGDNQTASEHFIEQLLYLSQITSPFCFSTLNLAQHIQFAIEKSAFRTSKVVLM